MVEVIEGDGSTQPKETVRRGSVVLLLLFSILLCVVGSASKSHAEGCKKTGTFSTLYFHEEAGDLLGEEIRIVYTDDGYVGTYQHAEGGAGSLLFFQPVLDEACNLSFSLQTVSGTVDFKGKIFSDSIEGVLHRVVGEDRKVIYPRKQSYWD